MLQFLYDIGDKEEKVNGVARLVMVCTAAITMVTADLAALIYVIGHPAPLAAKLGIPAGSTLLITLTSSLLARRRRKRRKTVTADPANDEPADPEGNASGG